MTAPGRPHVAIAVHGRFHAFDLARGLVECGADVTLLTNYPKRIVRQFGFDPKHVHSLLPHGIASRLAGRIGDHAAETYLHPWFGRWAADRLERLGGWHSTNTWSGVALEWLERPSDAVRIVQRGSAHIRAQRELLDEEERRAGVRIDKPTDWMVDREEAEYARADLIVVPSIFAGSTFHAKGIDHARVAVVPLATNSWGFEASSQDVDARIRRVLAGEPLRVLYVGTLSYQKGIFDLEAIIHEADAQRFRFRLVGPIREECVAAADRLRGKADVIGHVSREALRAQYTWADVLVLPSIQDGFAVVLSQAAAAGVPFVASTHSGGRDLLSAGAIGWVLPPREPVRWLDTLNLLEGDRPALADGIAQVAGKADNRSWQTVATELLRKTESVMTTTKAHG